MKIYVVMRSEGEYSDRRLWIQTAFLLEERAKAWVNETDAKVRQFYVDHGDDPIWDDEAVMLAKWREVMGPAEEDVPSSYNRPSFYIEQAEVQV